MKAAKYLLIIGLLIVIAVAGLAFYLPKLNGYKQEGSLTLPGLSEPVRVVRDEKGMAYIYAKDLHDAVLAQGFVTAQDRLFHMQVTRMLASGRISELAGEKAKDLDVRMRTIGIYRNAKKHAGILNERTKGFIQRYVDGINAFIKTRPGSRQIEFSLAGVQPEPWEVADSLAVAYYMGWITSGNLSSEILAQMLVDKLGPDRASELFPLNINPDEEGARSAANTTTTETPCRLNIGADKKIVSYLDDSPHGRGSNNWAVSALRSPHGKPVVANDPHLDARILPGIWYPCGIITPELRTVGVMVPGIPGMVIGRTDRIALGVTNAYGDCQDLYIETLDPNDSGRYMEGSESIPFEVKEERLRIKDKKSPGGFREETLQIKYTRRGPVVSGVLRGMKTGRILTLRWAAAESMGHNIGLEELLKAGSADEISRGLKNLNFIVLNFVFADADGNIGWRVSGKLPMRTQGDSSLPYAVKDGTDNWKGWIPFEDMPHSLNPSRGWVGTCNQKTVTKDYPYYFSSQFAPSYRYIRLKELLSGKGQLSADQHWEFQRDIVNVMSQAIAPVMAKALLKHEDTREMGTILAGWDCHDDPGKAAPAIFQRVYLEFLHLVLEDELGPELTGSLLRSGYFWQERMQRMVMEGASQWFDNKSTPDKVETRDELFHEAALSAAKEFEASLGKNPSRWLWGDVHRIQFVNALRRKGFGTSLLGCGPYPMGGSRETLYCAWFDNTAPFEVTVSASLRMVVDLGDEDKAIAVLPGGVTGRTFHSHMKDQVEPYMRGDKVYWWFSDKAIKEHRASTLLLNP